MEAALMAGVAAPPPGVALRCLSLQPGEPCGDMALALPLADGLLLAMVDGLGHGRAAAHAAQRALGLLQATPDLPLPELLARLDEGLRGTRGVAAGLARIGPGPSLRLAGVGNTLALHWRGGRPATVHAQPGVLGGALPLRVAEHQLALQPGDWILMHTDGLASPFELGPVLPEWRRDPQLLCEHLLARHRRATDDAGILVCHWQPGPEGALPEAPPC